MGFIPARTAVLVIVLGLFASIVTGAISTDAECKYHPECGKGVACKKRTCENCKKHFDCSCKKYGYVHTYYSSSGRKKTWKKTCEKTCTRRISCQSNDKCFVPCKKDPNSICECGLRNIGKVCLYHWNQYAVRICPKECEKRCRPGRECIYICHCYSSIWKEKCIPPSPSSSPSPSPSPSSSVSYSPSVSPLPSPSPVIILYSLESTNLTQVSGRTLGIYLSSYSGIRIGDKVTVSNFAVTGGTIYRIDLNQGESVLSSILSAITCTYDLIPLPFPMSVRITVKDIGKGIPGIFYQITGQPFYADSCKIPEFKFSVSSTQ